MRTWASLGAVRGRPVPDWNYVTRMIDAVRPAMEVKASQLRSLLEKSRAKLAPLGEPLDLDLGLHRWLDPEREEAYSDWLAWVIQQAKTPARVFQLFGLPMPAALSDDAAFDVQREDPVPFGHEGQTGRLDVLVSVGGEPALIVEVKKGDAGADAAKHAGYKLSYPNAKGVLLAVSANESNDEDFRSRSWKKVCIEMRLLAIELCKDKNATLAAAMVLAFAAAVEQNLVGLSVVSERLDFASASVVGHLRDFLNEVER